MTGHQKGDQTVLLNDTSYRLRLTLGALAEINTRLGTTGPQSLSGLLRSLTSAQARALLACLMRPCLPSGVCVDRSAAQFSKADMARAMPAICRLFEEAFRHDR